MIPHARFSSILTLKNVIEDSRSTVNPFALRFESRSEIIYFLVICGKSNNNFF